MRRLYRQLRERWAPIQKRLIRRYADYHARRGTPGRVYRIVGRGYRMWLPISWGKTVALRRFGVFEPWTFHALKRSVKPGATVMEIGACYGEFTIYVSRLVGSAGKVYAFELLPQNFEILERNIRLNRLTNVECLNVGVAPRGVESIRISAGPSHLYEGLGQISGRAYPTRTAASAPELIDVRCVSLLDFMSDSAHRRPDYLFMDIEACEVELFRELETEFREQRWRPTIYMETHPQFYKPGDRDFLKSTLLASAYAIEEIGNHWLCTPQSDVRH